MILISGKRRVGIWGRRIPLWVTVGIVVTATAGVAVGAVMAAGASGRADVTVSQAVVIDRDNFTLKDVKRDISDKAVTFNDDGTGLTLAAEFHTGEDIILDVPLANLSGQNASAIAALLVPPGFRKDIEVFWNTLTRSTTPSAQTTGPSPSPLTAVTPQPSDTNPWLGLAPPPGAAGINVQISDSSGTTSSPGLPASQPQTKNADSTNTKPAGTQDNAARTANATSVTTTQPSGAASVTSRTINFTPVLALPSGPSIAAQTANTAAGTNVKPDPDLPGTGGGVDRWYTRQFSLDWDADGALEPVYFVLTDIGNNGSIDYMDISSDDGDFGETSGGPLSGQSPRMTGPDDDERITASGTDVRIGPYYTFTVAFAANGSQASLTGKTRYTATILNTDLDGDGVADDTFYAAISDVNSDGIYDRLDLSVGDSVFGETANVADANGNGIADGLEDGVVDYSADNNSEDERRTGPAAVRLGVNTFGFGFNTTPGEGP